MSKILGIVYSYCYRKTSLADYIKEINEITKKHNITDWWDTDAQDGSAIIGSDWKDSVFAEELYHEVNGFSSNWDFALGNGDNIDEEYSKESNIEDYPDFCEAIKNKQWKLLELVNYDYSTFIKVEVDDDWRSIHTSRDKLVSMILNHPDLLNIIESKKSKFQYYFGKGLSPQKILKKMHQDLSGPPALYDTRPSGFAALIFNLDTCYNNGTYYVIRGKDAHLFEE